jgi:hypothetical protein
MSISDLFSNEMLLELKTLKQKKNDIQYVLPKF